MALLRYAISRLLAGDGQAMAETALLLAGIVSVAALAIFGVGNPAIDSLWQRAVNAFPSTP